jgi:hypothetical protein
MSHRHTALPTPPSNKLHLPSRPQLKGLLSMKPSLMFTLHPRQTAKNRKTSKLRSDMAREEFQKDHSGCSVEGALKREILKTGKPINKKV